MFKIEDSGEDRRMVRHYIIWWVVLMAVGEPEIEVENVPNMVTDEGYKVACECVSLRGRERDLAE